ncbi:DUF4255 domain-containing protein [Ruania zhangjianzhongii]|uniref:DUF4255 domain-containing protein n=1 Tax=Ruania zhangjianzhongii TaxID=2603206 RepID=UPI0011CCDE25|nr:DUF4255 domain-containing protein [Ruania zhangjianzhongii]
MIPEIDDLLRTIVAEEALAGSDVEVVFEAPTTDWAARRNAPTVNLYLYDIREDLRWRERGLFAKTHDGQVTGRQPPPRLFKLSYLVTAWTQRPEDEHRLLDTLLLTLGRYQALPTDRLGGTLAAARPQPLMTVGLPPPEDRGFADVWSSLGGQLKPSVDLVITAPLVAETRAVGPLAADGLGVITEATTTGSTDPRRTVHRPPPPAGDGAARVAESASPGSGGGKARARGRARAPRST